MRGTEKLIKPSPSPPTITAAAEIDRELIADADQPMIRADADQERRRRSDGERHPIGAHARGCGGVEYKPTASATPHSPRIGNPSSPMASAKPGHRAGRPGGPGLAVGPHGGGDRERRKRDLDVVMINAAGRNWPMPGKPKTASRSAAQAASRPASRQAIAAVAPIIGMSQSTGHSPVHQPLRQGRIGEGPEVDEQAGHRHRSARDQWES